MGCRFGDKCFLSHSNPNSIRLCPLLQSATGCHYGNGCYDRHKVYSDDISADKLKAALKEKEDVFIIGIKKQICAIKNSLYRHHASSLEMLTVEQKANISSKCKATLLTAAKAVDKLQEELVDHSKTRKLLYQDFDKQTISSPVTAIKQNEDGVGGTAGALKTNPFLSGDGERVKGNGTALDGSHGAVGLNGLNGSNGSNGSVPVPSSVLSSVSSSESTGSRVPVGSEKENVNGLNQKKRTRTESVKEQTNGNIVAVVSGQSGCSPQAKRMRLGEGIGNISTETRGTFQFDM